MKSGPLCALLWRILTWCTRRQLTLTARHIPGQLNVIADKLSRVGQTIQSDLFTQTCSRPYVPGGTNKLPQFVSSVPDPQAWAVDALSLSWEDLDLYAFPPVAILGKVVEKLQDYLCNRIILIAPGWSNMPWFWDLVAMSSQIPLCLPSLPNLVTQPFNQILHRNLSNLNRSWLHKNIRHQSHWSKVSLYPTPSFLSKNQLAEKGPDSVAPMVIPALAPTRDKSLKGDRSLCPVRALRYYFDRTSDLRQNKVFVSFMKGFDKDISPVTISSWIKQTVILL